MSNGNNPANPFNEVADNLAPRKAFHNPLSFKLTHEQFINAAQQMQNLRIYLSQCQTDNGMIKDKTKLADFEYSAFLEEF